MWKIFLRYFFLKGVLKVAFALAISRCNALPLPGWLLVHEESIVLLFSLENRVHRLRALHKVLVSNGEGVSSSPNGIETSF